MNSFLPGLSSDLWDQALLKWAVDLGLAGGTTVVLVAARLSGLFLIGPLLGKSVLTWSVRIGLIVLLTMTVAPLLIPFPAAATQAVTQDNLTNGKASGVNSVVGEMAPMSNQHDAGSTSIRSLLATHASPISLIAALLWELVIGAAMGFCVSVFLHGIQLGGAWLDRHSGLGMGTVLNPDVSADGFAPAEILSLFCVISLLVLQPSGGHLRVMRLVFDTFHAIPVGSSELPSSLVDLCKTIVQQSLVLGVRIAMPFVVAMSLLDLTLGFVNRSSRFPLGSIAYACRVAVSLLILAATIPGIQEAVTATFLESLDLASRELLASPAADN